MKIPPLRLNLLLQIIKIEKDPLKKRAYYFRLTAAILNAAIVAITMQETQAKIEKSKGEELVKVEEKQSANLVAMVKNLWYVDFSICYLGPKCKLTEPYSDIVTYGNSAKIVEMLIGRSYDDGTSKL